MKRIILLISMLLLGFYWTKPVSAAVVDSGTCGENATWEFDDEGTLTISGTGKIESYSAGSKWVADEGGKNLHTIPVNLAPWKNYASEIKTVLINNGITSVGGHAFFACSSIVQVQLPNTVTELSYGAFSGCTSLESISLPEGLLTLEGTCFSGCTQLKTINIPENITEIPTDCFTNCGFQSFNIPNHVTKIGFQAFYYCRQLSSVSIPDSVSSIGEAAFKECIKLNNVVLPNSVTVLESHLFYNCSSLKKITIPTSVTTIKSKVFFGCSALSDFSLWSQLNTIEEHAFTGTGLSNIEISNDSISLGKNAFGYYVSGSENIDGISTDVYSKKKEFIIEANPNSAAHTYAKENGIQFSCINHTPVVVPGKEATAESTGLTEGLKCSGCGKIFKEQKVIPKIEIEVKEKHDATYFATNKPAVLTTRIKNSTIQRVSWRSSNKKWATVQGKGPNNSTCVVKPKKAGIGHTVTITATVYYYVNDSSSGSVKVMALSSSSKKVRKTTLKYKGKITKKITLKSISGTGKVYVGKSIKLKVKPGKARKMVRWKSSNTSVATVSNGKVRGRKEGTVTITCITKDTNHSKRTKRIKVVKKKKSKK